MERVPEGNLEHEIAPALLLVAVRLVVKEELVRPSGERLGKGKRELHCKRRVEDGDH